jgi:hypothetical protein
MNKGFQKLKELKEQNRIIDILENIRISFSLKLQNNTIKDIEFIIDTMLERVISFKDFNVVVTINDFIIKCVTEFLEKQKSTIIKNSLDNGGHRVLQEENGKGITFIISNEINEFYNSNLETLLNIVNNKIDENSNKKTQIKRLI